MLVFNLFNLFRMCIVPVLRSLRFYVLFYVIHLFYVLNRLTLIISSPRGILKNYYRCMQVSVWHRSSRRQHVFSFACVRIRYRGYECVYVCVYMRACVRRCEREYTYTNIYLGTSMLSSFCHFWTVYIDPDNPSTLALYN